MNINKYLTPNDALRALVGSGKFHTYSVEVSKSIVIMVEKDHAEVAGQIAAHFEKINKEYSLSVRCVVDLDKSVADLTNEVTVPELDALISTIKADTNSTQLPPQMIGRALRKLEPKEGEVWLVRSGSRNEVVTICEGQFLHGEIYKSHGCIDVKDDSIIERLYTQEERNQISDKWRETFDAKDLQCQEHARTVTKLSEGLAIITDACKDRGFGDKPYEDIVHLLNEAERKLADLHRSGCDDVYPLIDRSTYMCVFKYSNRKITHPCMWYAGGWHFGSTPLSQSENDPTPLYRMVRDEPKEQVTLQIDGLPPIGSEVYMKPNSEAGGGKPGLKSEHAERKLKIHAHFTDDRGVNLAAYVSCDDAPIVGGVASAMAFETEDDKFDRELDYLLSEVKFSGGDKVLFRPGVDAVKAALIGSNFLKK